MELMSFWSLMRFTRKVPPTGRPPLGGGMEMEFADVASTNESRRRLFVGSTVRSVLVRMTVKLVGSVSTRFHASVFVPDDTHPEELLGVVTWRAAAESARARTDANERACIAKFFL